MLIGPDHPDYEYWRQRDQRARESMLAFRRWTDRAFGFMAGMVVATAIALTVISMALPIR